MSDIISIKKNVKILVKTVSCNIRTNTGASVPSQQFLEFEAVKERAQQVQCLALALFVSSMVATARCYWTSEPNIYIQLPSYLSLPIFAVFYIFACVKVQQYEFPKTVVNFADASSSSIPNQ